MVENLINKTIKDNYLANNNTSSTANLTSSVLFKTLEESTAVADNYKNILVYSADAHHSTLGTITIIFILIIVTFAICMRHLRKMPSLNVMSAKHIHFSKYHKNRRTSKLKVDKNRADAYNFVEANSVINNQKTINNSMNLTKNETTNIDLEGNYIQNLSGYNKSTTEITAVTRQDKRGISGVNPFRQQRV